MSYDFLIQDILLLEYQGEFHDGTAVQQSEEGFEIQKRNDNLKKEYAIDKGIKLLEIWYYDFNNIESILDKQLQQLNNLSIQEAI